MATSNKVRKGNDLMVFVNVGTESAPDYRSVAFATQHQISTTLETDTIQTKDSGYDGVELPKNITWEISSDNLYVDGEASKMYKLMLDKAYVQVQWGVGKDHATSDAKTTAEGLTNDDTIDTETNYWVPDTSYGSYKGKALITSFSVSSEAGSNSTYSITLKGSGSITAVDAE